MSTASLKSRLDKPPTYLVALLVVIVMYVAGMMMALFGPPQGWLLSIPAFLASMLLWAMFEARRKRGTLSYLAESRPSVECYRPVLSFAVGLCAVVAGISLITMFVAGSAGVIDGTGPVFEQQTVYRLANHGKYTIVSRSRYVVAGSSAVISWHIMGTIFALYALHLVLFGERPTDFEGGKGDI